MNFSKQFYNASLLEIKQGYVYEPETEEYVCIICSERFVKGRVYNLAGAFFEAEKAMRTHIAEAHSSTFEVLLELDKKYTGLTEHQKKLLLCFYRNLSDKEIASQMENDNTSTIRNHRFSFREKAKQAKIFLAIMELLEEHGSKAEKLVEIPPGVSMADDRFVITEEENEKIIKTYFQHGLAGPLSNFPGKEKRKIAILRQLIRRFDPGRKYTEPEVNGILQNAFDDYVTLRRYLIEYGFLDRYPDGSLYWVKE
jgi:hypothetical protein